MVLNLAGWSCDDYSIKITLPNENTEMANDELLEEYSESIRRLRNQWRETGMTDEEFRSLYFESLNSFDNDNQERISRRSSIRKLKFFILCFVLVCCVAYNYKTIHSTFMCNLQEYIYPGLKLLRRLAIPFISLFPSLTAWYHETCLIQNPFFSVVDMDCWPCSSVTNVREVHEPKPGHQHSAPFIYETNQHVLSLEAIRELYMTSKDVFDKYSPKILVNDKYHISPEDVFNEKHHDHNFYVWRFDDMTISRKLRRLIPRPTVVPKFGQSTERFLILDTSREPHAIPDTECSFSFLLSLHGKRTVDLVPAEECSHQCKRLTVELKETYLLWYNWWYWRPVVRPSDGNSTFIAHVGSYC